MIAWDIKDSTLSKVERVENYLRLVVSPATILTGPNSFQTEWLDVEILLIDPIADEMSINTPVQILSGFVKSDNNPESILTLPYSSPSQAQLELKLKNHGNPLRIVCQSLKIKSRPS